MTQRPEPVPAREDQVEQNAWIRLNALLGLPMSVLVVLILPLFFVLALGAARI